MPACYSVRRRVDPVFFLTPDAGPEPSLVDLNSPGSGSRAAVPGRTTPPHDLEDET